MQTPSVYEIPYVCGKSYIGKTRRAIEIQIQEKERDVKYERAEKSAVAEYAKKTRTLNSI